MRIERWNGPTQEPPRSDYYAAMIGTKILTLWTMHGECLGQFFANRGELAEALIEGNYIDETHYCVRHDGLEF